VPQVLGIDIGGTKVALAIGGSDGRLVAQRRRALGSVGDARQDVLALAEDARGLLAGAGLDPAAIDAVGVSAPGPLDRASGRVQGPPNLPGWDDVPLAALLAEALHRPVHLENDANAAALAEWRFGAAAGLRHVVFLTMSTGVGAGLVLGGRLHRGAGEAAGELGHAPVEWPGEPCACGLRGCLEAYVGGAAWTRRLRRLAPAEGPVARAAGGRARVTPEHVVAAARSGDAFARAEMERFNEYVSRALVPLVATLAPDAVVLGTIPTAAGEALCLAPVRERVRARTFAGAGARVRILASGLGRDLAAWAGICVGLEALDA